jgi:hypothetical protein
MNLDKNYKGIDADLETSLEEYGFVARPITVDYPDEFFVIYKMGENQYGSGHIRESELDAIVNATEWASDEDINSMLDTVGSSKEEWMSLPFESKLNDLISYWGTENVMGTDYYPNDKKWAFEEIGIDESEEDDTFEINSISELYDWEESSQYPYARDMVAYFIFGDRDDNLIDKAIRGVYSKERADASKLSEIMLGYEYNWKENMEQLDVDTVEELGDLMDYYAKGGSVKDNLEKELHKLQKELNSSRLRTYTEGDDSEEEMARRRERESKLVRFNEVLKTLNEIDKDSFSDGGETTTRTISYEDGGLAGLVDEEQMRDISFKIKVKTMPKEESIILHEVVEIEEYDAVGEKNVNLPKFHLIYGNNSLAIFDAFGVDEVAGLKREDAVEFIENLKKQGKTEKDGSFMAGLTNFSGDQIFMFFNVERLNFKGFANRVLPHEALHLSRYLISLYKNKWMRENLNTPNWWEDKRATFTELNDDNEEFFAETLERTTAIAMDGWFRATGSRCLADGGNIGLFKDGGETEESRLVGSFYYDTRKDKTFRIIYSDKNKIQIQYFNRNKEEEGKLIDVPKDEFNYLLQMGAWFKSKQSFFKDGGETGGYNDSEVPTHVLHIDNQNWYLQKIDSTHFYMSNDPNFRGTAHHIGQHKGELYYDEVRQWLKDTQFAKGGGIKESKKSNSPQNFFLSEEQLKGLTHEKIGHIDFYYKKNQKNRYDGAVKEVYFKDGFRPSNSVSFESEPKKVYDKLKEWVKIHNYNFDDIIAVKYADGGEVDDNDLEQLWLGYASAILFSELDSDTEEPLDENYSISDFDEETVKSSKDLIRKFYIDNKEAIKESGLDLDTIGNDIWYTRAGHGAGFFDHSLDQDIEDKLTNGAKALGEYPTVETYDGKISVRGGRVFKKGGSVKSKAEKLFEERISYRWKNTDMGSGWLIKLDSPNDDETLEEELYLDIYDFDEDEYSFEDWKEDMLQTSKESFIDKYKEKYFDDFVEYIQRDKDDYYADGGGVDNFYWEELTYKQKLSLVRESGLKDVVANKSVGVLTSNELSKLKNSVRLNRETKTGKFANGGGVESDNFKRFDVDFYDSSNANLNTSIELIIRQNSLKNAIKDAVKKAYELKKNYIEFYHRGFFLGSVNFAKSNDFIKGKFYKKFMSNDLYSDGGGVYGDYYAKGGDIENEFYIFEGIDHYSSTPLFRVESTSDSDAEYVGEWHTDRNKAEKELRELNGSSFEEDIYSNVDEELIRVSAEEIYNEQGFMNFRNLFLKLADTDERSGDIETANFRRALVKEYQEKQPRIK